MYPGEVDEEAFAAESRLKCNAMCTSALAADSPQERIIADPFCFASMHTLWKTVLVTF